MGYTFDEGLDDVWHIQFRTGKDTGDKFMDVSTGNVGDEFPLTYWRPFKYPHQINGGTTHTSQQAKASMVALGIAGSRLIGIDTDGNPEQRQYGSALGTGTIACATDMRCGGYLNVPHGRVFKRLPEGINVEADSLWSYTVTGDSVGSMRLTLTNFTVRMYLTKYNSAGTLLSWYNTSSPYLYTNLDKQCIVWQINRSAGNVWTIWMFSTLFTSTVPSVDAHINGHEYVPTPALTTPEEGYFDTFYNIRKDAMYMVHSVPVAQTKYVGIESADGNRSVTREELKQLWLNMKARNGIA
jgi:hypothetical protein